MCEDGSVSHWINVSFPPSGSRPLVWPSRVKESHEGQTTRYTSLFLIVLPFHSLHFLPKRSPFFLRCKSIAIAHQLVDNTKEQPREKCAKERWFSGERWLSMVVARWKSSRVISFPLTGLQNVAIVEYTAAKSDDLYRIDSGNGTRWDTRAFEISFGYRGWLLNVDGRCRIHLTNKVERRISIFLL